MNYTNAGINVWGVTADELKNLLLQHFPDRDCRISESNGASTVPESLDQNRDGIIEKLKSELESKKKENDDLFLKIAASTASIHAFHSQQKQLYDEFCLLRTRYDDQKQCLIDTLWTKCVAFHDDLRHIPGIDESVVANESDGFIGKYAIGDHLGEGQFATVKACWLNDASSDHDEGCAIKIIKKERLTSFSALKRVSNEIDILQTLRSRFVVRLQEAIQSSNKLYIVTEKGGKDLFEFFDEHPEGVPEPWAKEITICMLQGILYCHQQGICHRDLKPENILLKFNYETEKCDDLKLCDFGLSTKFNENSLLSDFCGSPGFFAPEMIIHGSYYGDMADVWSTGCILLELILGHERFCDAWMSAYDFDILQDKLRFEDMIKSAVQALPDALDFPPSLKDFVIQFLKLRSSERPAISSICKHDWVVNDFPVSVQFSKLSVETSTDADTKSRRIESPSLNKGRSNKMGGEVNMESILKVAGSSVSDRERKMYEDHNTHINGLESDDTVKDSIALHHTIHLPPIDPQTPSVGKFRKILKKAEESLPPGEQWSIEEESKSTTAQIKLDLHLRHHDGPSDLSLPMKLSPRQALLLSSNSSKGLA